MICGSPGMLRDLKHMLEGARLQGRQHLDAGRLRHRAGVRRTVRRETRCTRTMRRQPPAKQHAKRSQRRTGVRELAAQATRDSILRAATKVFAKHGYDGGSVEKISKAAKSYDRMIYYYFGSKEGLFIAVLEEIYRRFNEAEAALDAGRGAAGGVAHGGDPLRVGYYQQEPRVHHAAEHREPAPRQAHRQVAAGARVLVAGDRRSSTQLLRSGVAQGLFRADVAARDVYLMIAAHGLLLHVQPVHAVGLPRRDAGGAGGAGALGRLRDRHRAAHGARRQSPPRARPPSRHQRHGRTSTWQKSMADASAQVGQGRHPEHRPAAVGRHRPAHPRRRHHRRRRRPDRRGRQGEGLRHCEGADTVIDARRTCVAPGPDRQPRASGVRRLDAAPEPARLDRLDDERRRHHHDLGRRGAPAGPAQGHRRPEGAGHHRAARLRQLPPRRRQGAGRRAGHREGHGRERLQGAGRGRRRRCSARSAWAR